MYTVVAQYEDILVVGLHEVTLSRNLLNGFGITVQLAQLARVILVATVIVF